MYQGFRNGQKIFIPVIEKTLYHDLVESKRHLIINDIAKERETVRYIKESVSMKRFQNCLLVPMGSNSTKGRNAIILLLFNKKAKSEGQDET